MSTDSEMIIALGKVMIAAAWADGQVTYEEVNSLKDILFRLPGLNATDWAELDIYIESPVGEAERDRLIDDLKVKLRNAGDKRLALDALDQLIDADDIITDDERAVVEQIKQEIEGATVGVIAGLGRLLRGSAQRRSAQVSGAPNREQYLDDFVKNKVYYNLKTQLEADGESFDLSDEDLRKLGLAGGLMGQVAWVDDEVEEGEFDAIVRAFMTHWNLSEAEAKLVAEIAVSEISAKVDRYRTAREFYTVSDREERMQMLDIMFDVAASDGQASHLEIETIRAISMTLKISHPEFIEAKLKVPKEKREL